MAYCGSWANAQWHNRVALQLSAINIVTAVAENNGHHAVAAALSKCSQLA